MHFMSHESWPSITILGRVPASHNTRRCRINIVDYQATKKDLSVILSFLLWQHHWQGWKICMSDLQSNGRMDHEAPNCPRLELSKIRTRTLSQSVRKGWKEEGNLMRKRHCCTGWLEILLCVHTSETFSRSHSPQNYRNITKFIKNLEG